MKAGLLITAFATGLAGVAALASSPGHDTSRQGHAQPYAGQQDRTVSSFSNEELAGYLDGRGLGLARPAELNGYPGPMHILELAAELALTADQHRGVETSFARMKEAARNAGRRYVAAEEALDRAFESGTVSADAVERLVRQADALRAEVRLSHLKAHLEVTPLLSAAQKARYAELRGYAAAAGHGHDRKKH